MINIFYLKHFNMQLGTIFYIISTRSIAYADENLIYIRSQTNLLNDIPKIWNMYVKRFLEVSIMKVSHCKNVICFKFNTLSFSMSMIIKANALKEYGKEHKISTVFPASGTIMVNKIIYQVETSLKFSDICTGNGNLWKSLYKYTLVSMLRLNISFEEINV